MSARLYPMYLLTIYCLFQAGSLLSWVGGWVGVVLFRFKASLSSTGTWLPTGTELGNKSTFFTGTLKVWENKVVLLFSVLPYFLRYGRFMNFFGRNRVFEWQMKNGHKTAEMSKIIFFVKFCFQYHQYIL